MAITRAQQVRQMLKDGEVAIQGGAKNYLGKQKTVSGVPVKWQSGPDAPPTELAYITKKEKDLLLKADIHGSLKDGPNTGPDGIMSLDSQGDFTEDRSGGKKSTAGPGPQGNFRETSNVRNTTGGPRAKGPTFSVATGGDNQPFIGGGGSGGSDDPDDQPIKDLQDKQFNFIDLITNRRKGAYNLATMIPGSKANITKMRKAYADYLKSMGITPTDELEDTDNLFDFFNKQAFEKGKTIYSDPTVANQEIYDKLVRDMSQLDFNYNNTLENRALKNQLEKYTQEEFMAQNPDLFSKGTPTDVQSYGDFILENFGSPGVKFSGNVGNIEVFKKSDGTYGYREKRDGGGGDNVMSDYERRLLELEQQLKDQQAAAPTTTQNPLAYRFMADGGIMNSDSVGGMMDGNMDEMGRQMYGLGKLVKKATRGIKKLVKSPIGKAALGFAAFKFGPQFLTGKGLGLGNIKKFSDLKFLGEGANVNFNRLIGLTSLAPMLFQTDEEEENFDPYRGPDIDIDKIRSDPYGAMGGAYRFAADGGIMRAGYQEGGDAEPVAKKTMPLIDMDGKEKDYRETGGFVDMGRMERADDVPARLSKNEFVFTADAVRNAGEGDIDKGAEVMYNMMKNLEAGGEVSEESQGLEGARNMFQTSQRLGEVI